MKNLIFIAKSMLLFFLFFASSFHVKAQLNEGIINFQPIPAMPNSAEVLQFEIESLFFSAICELNEYQVDISGFTVWVGICYNVGDATISCFSKDTITIGQLSAGDFEFIFQSFKYNYDEGCFEQDINTDTVVVTIAQHTSTGMDVEEAGITFQPNPFTDHFIIHLASDAMHHPVSLRLYDYMGREVYFQTLDRSMEYRVNSTHLPAGVYMYRMELENGQEVSGKVVKY